MRGNIYQIFLIILSILGTALFGVFLYRELHPEYKIYQNDYVALENFRSTYTGAPPSPFKEGVKQIILTKKNKGPEDIDRCISCHVALSFEHFSPTKIAYDINGQIEYDDEGIPKQIPNENYVWGKLEDKINSLRDADTNKKLEAEGKYSEVNKRLAQAATYEALKTATVGDNTYDVTKALAMHPLIGREIRPFEMHPIDEYGCVICHSGNGRGLTTEKAHGPVFDGAYEIENMGPIPEFLEKDSKNDPRFASIFNHKPGHALLFQTTPILVGSLIESKCVQCHNSSNGDLEQAYQTANQSIAQRQENLKTITTAYNDEIQAITALLRLKNAITKNGFEKTLSTLESEQSNYDLSPEDQQRIHTQFAFLKKNQSQPELAQHSIHDKLLQMVGSEKLVNELKKQFSKENNADTVQKFVAKHQNTQDNKGSLFSKAEIIAASKDSLLHINETKKNLSKIVSNKTQLSKLISHVDMLTKNYQRGEQLYISQACYACHRIEGLSRGGVGPDLTEEGNKYPWYIKESIVWPQSNFKNSTMPNYHLDHDELEDLTTFLLAQTGERKYESATAHKIAIAQWESSKKRVWEEPLSPSRIHNIDDAMVVFATEGCAACHRLKGFESNVGFAIENDENLSFEKLDKEREWFSKLFPENILGSEIVTTIENQKELINNKIVDGIRKNSLLEKLQTKDPQSVAQFYSNFKYAFRAKNNHFRELEKSNSLTAEEINKKRMDWQDLVQKVLMIYVQEYGLGRIIGPKPNWSGVYRSDKWLMEHFFNPPSVIRRSIMPVMPFDTTKFYALTYMLDSLGIRNRNEVRRPWDNEGFSPEKAFQTLCSQCHGEYLQGNGPVSLWIYPIPKNLRSADFLRNLTKEKAYESIHHGVKGTPMPSWGETSKDKPFPDNQPVLTENEIVQIVDWLFSSLPGGSLIRTSEEVPKWQYSPENVIDELKREKGQLKSLPDAKEATSSDLSALKHSSEIDSYYAALVPRVATPQKNDRSDTNVEDIFNVVPHKSVDSTISNYYYIKQKYYTPENIKSGREFFELNCAVCHGREADGSGDRANLMVDAKPRMLTNLSWLDSKDDLRLLRSIKYGVPGSSMVAWGDQTSSLQRLQLVIFIHSISKDSKFREELMDHIFDTFNSAQYTLEKFRIALSPPMIESEMKLSHTKEQLAREQNLVEQNITPTDAAVNLYKQKLLEEQSLKQFKTQDDLLQKIITEVNNEKELFLELGLSILANKQIDIKFENYNHLIDLEKNRYSVDNGTLSYTPTPEDKFKAAVNTLKKEIETQIKSINQQNIIRGGKITSPDVREEILLLTTTVNTLKTLQNKFTTFTEEVLQSQKKQQALVNQLNQTPDAHNASKTAK